MTMERNLFSCRRGLLFQAIDAIAPIGRGKRGDSLFKVFTSLFSRLRSSTIRKYRLKRDLRHVSQLDKRMLNDIGLDPELYHRDLRYGRDAGWRL